MIARAVALVIAMATVGGCYRATLNVQPASSLIAQSDGTVSGPPAPVRVRPWPLRAPRVTIEAPGYGTYAFKVRWRLGAALGRGRAIDVILERDQRRAAE